MDHTIPTKIPDLVSVYKKRTCQLIEFTFPADYELEIKESENHDNLAKSEDMIENEGDSDTNRNWSSWNCPIELGK